MELAKRLPHALRSAVSFARRDPDTCHSFIELRAAPGIGDFPARQLLGAGSGQRSQIMPPADPQTLVFWESRGLRYPVINSRKSAA